MSALREWPPRPSPFLWWQTKIQIKRGGNKITGNSLLLRPLLVVTDNFGYVVPVVRDTETSFQAGDFSSCNLALGDSIAQLWLESELSQPGCRWWACLTVCLTEPKQTLQSTPWYHQKRCRHREKLCNAHIFVIKKWIEFEGFHIMFGKGAQNIIFFHKSTFYRTYISFASNLGWYESDTPTCFFFYTLLRGIRNKLQLKL